MNCIFAMSLHYIIDGYNVIKQVDFLTGRKLQDGREGLVRFIERYHPHGSVKNEVTLVFDGKPQISSPAMNTSVRVIFSQHESADDKIKYIVEHSRNPKRIVVVSDDKQIIFYCRSLGAQIKSVKEFLVKEISRHKGSKIDEDEEKPELDSAVAAFITEQLKKLWIR